MAGVDVLDQAGKLVQVGDLEAAIELIYDHCHAGLYVLDVSKFKQTADVELAIKDLNGMLSEADVQLLKIEPSLALLTATHRHQSHFSSYASFYNKVKDELVSGGASEQDVRGALTGLHPRA